jgi:hypothetical protein
MQLGSLLAAEEAWNGDDCMNVRAGATRIEVESAAVPGDAEPSAEVTAEANPGGRGSGDP